MINVDLSLKYSGKNILITGGLGFLGSNLAHALVRLGAKVTIVNSFHSVHDNIFFNLKGIKAKIKVVLGDIRDRKLMEKLVKNKSVIFNLAGGSKPSDSNISPFHDLDVNCRGHLTLLEACRENNPNIQIVFSSSRMVYGKTVENPVTDNHPTNPLSLYGIHKITAEKYHLMYGKHYGLKTIILRITNPYGPRQQIKSGKYGLPGWFMKLAMDNKPIELFGDGKQLRDYIYVNDVIEVFLRVASNPNTDGDVFNCGSGVSYELKEMAEAVIEIVGQGKINYISWPENYRQIESGDFKVDISKLSNAIEWQPLFSLNQGLKIMFEYYKRHKNKYL